MTALLDAIRLSLHYITCAKCITNPWKAHTHPNSILMGYRSINSSYLMDYTHPNTNLTTYWSTNPKHSIDCTHPNPNLTGYWSTNPNYSSD